MAKTPEVAQIAHERRLDIEAAQALCRMTDDRFLRAGKCLCETYATPTACARELAEVAALKSEITRLRRAISLP